MMRRLLIISVLLITVLIIMRASGQASNPAPVPTSSIVVGPTGFWDFGDYLVRVQNPHLQSLKQFNEKSDKKGLIIEFWHKEPLEAGRLTYFTSCPSEIHYLPQGFDDEFDKYKYLIIVIPKPGCEEEDQPPDFLVDVVLLSKPKPVPGKPYMVVEPEADLFTVRIPHSVLFSSENTSVSTTS